MVAVVYYSDLWLVLVTSWTLLPPRVHSFNNNYNIHIITHALSPKGQQRHPRSTEMPIFYLYDLALGNTVDVTGGKHIAVKLQYNIHGRKREVLFYSSIDQNQNIRCHNVSTKSNTWYQPSKQPTPKLFLLSLSNNSHLYCKDVCKINVIYFIERRHVSKISVRRINL
jgi:hypothetical protein